MMAEFHLAASVSGSWYCLCWLTSLLGHFKVIRATVIVVSNTWALPCQVKMSAVREAYCVFERCKRKPQLERELSFLTLEMFTETILTQGPFISIFQSFQPHLTVFDNKLHPLRKTIRCG